MVGVGGTWFLTRWFTAWAQTLAAAAWHSPHTAHLPNPPTSPLPDCEHEVLPLRSGHRVVLTYNLVWAGEGPPPAPSVPEGALQAAKLAGKVLGSGRAVAAADGAAGHWGAALVDVTPRRVRTRSGSARKWRSGGSDTTQSAVGPSSQSRLLGIRGMQKRWSDSLSWRQSGRRTSRPPSERASSFSTGEHYSTRAHPTRLRWLSPAAWAGDSLEGGAAAVACTVTRRRALPCQCSRRLCQWTRSCTASTRSALRPAFDSARALLLWCTHAAPQVYGSLAAAARHRGAQGQGPRGGTGRVTKGGCVLVTRPLARQCALPGSARWPSRRGPNTGHQLRACLLLGSEACPAWKRGLPTHHTVLMPCRCCWRHARAALSWTHTWPRSAALLGMGRASCRPAGSNALHRSCRQGRYIYSPAWHCPRHLCPTRPLHAG